MTRRTQIGRTADATNAEARARDLGGCKIFCVVTAGVGVGSGGGAVLIGPITVEAAADYQRIFVAATIAGVQMASPE